MTEQIITIPRHRLTPILERHNDHWQGTHDPEAWTVRGAASLLRQSPEPDYKAEADELDALVDEVEAARHRLPEEYSGIVGTLCHLLVDGCTDPDCPCSCHRATIMKETR